MEQSNNKQQVFIEETFNVSMEKVFQAWTDPVKLMKWFAPEGCTIQFKKLQIETGGKFHSCVTHPQYGNCWCIGEYKEVLPHTKIVFTMINANEEGDPVNPADIGMDPEWPNETLVTILLSDENGKTKLQLYQTVSQELATRTGAYPSWLEMLENMRYLLINS